MKKVLIARNSADGVVASLLIQARFETCDPLFGGRADIYEELGVPLYSAGIKCRKCELYIDDAVKNLAESAWDVCPNDRYRSLVTACSEEDFLCFFDLYGASSCFGQLRYDPDSWKDENLQAYRKMQEETASRVLLSASGGKVEVFSLPETAGRLCRKLVFFETDAAVVLFLSGNRFWLRCRHGYEKAFTLKNFIVTERIPEISGFCPRQNPIKVREKLLQAVEKYEEKGELFR